jgi:hypothetical protein
VHLQYQQIKTGDGFTYTYLCPVTYCPLTDDFVTFLRMIKSVLEIIKS